MHKHVIVITVLTLFWSYRACLLKFLKTNNHSIRNSLFTAEAQVLLWSNTYNNYQSLWGPGNSPSLMVYNFIPQELTKINFLEQYARLIWLLIKLWLNLNLRLSYLIFNCFRGKLTSLSINSDWISILDWINFLEQYARLIWLLINSDWISILDWAI